MNLYGLYLNSTEIKKCHSERKRRISLFVQTHFVTVRRFFGAKAPQNDLFFIEFYLISDLPVISSGWLRPRICSIVGAISARTPSS